jgi:cephalosporin hydroxylase
MTRSKEMPGAAPGTLVKDRPEPWKEVVTTARERIPPQVWLRPDFAATMLLFYLDTGFATLRRGLRWALTRGRGGSRGERFVRLEDRRWISDLAWSHQLLRGIEKAKTNMLQLDPVPLHWKGAVLMKDPFDVAIYLTLVQELRPRTIIEVGAYQGGTAAWLADLLETLGIDGHVYAFDIDTDQIVARHPRVTFMAADSNNLSTFDEALLRDLPRPWLVIEDAHVNICEVLRFFDRHLRPGDYLAVEDLFAPSYYVPFLKFAAAASSHYRVDTRYTDLFGYNVSWNVNGYLRKIGAGDAA